MEISINVDTKDSEEALTNIYNLYKLLGQVTLSMIENGASIKVEIKSNENQIHD